MFRNNFVGLILHALIGFITFELFVFIDSLAINNKIQYGGKFYNYGAIFVFFFAIILYLLSGIILKKQKSKIESIFSVSSVSIIALSIWLFCFIITGGLGIGNDPNWIPFMFFTAYFFPILSTFSLDAPFSGIIFAIIPSLLMWLSMQIWQRKSNVVV